MRLIAGIGIVIATEAGDIRRIRLQMPAIVIKLADVGAVKIAVVPAFRANRIETSADGIGQAARQRSHIVETAGEIKITDIAGTLDGCITTTLQRISAEQPFRCGRNFHYRCRIRRRRRIIPTGAAGEHAVDIADFPIERCDRTARRIARRSALRRINALLQSRCWRWSRRWCTRALRITAAPTAARENECRQ